jgi:hypothetical protein
MATPKTTRQILDGNLTRAVPSGVFNRRILVLGTSKDGPMYTPVSVSSADDAAQNFGPFGSGSLTRGIKEAFDGQIGFSKSPDVWGMRVGGIKAKRASGDLDDALTNAVLKIEAINEGDMYNDVSVKFQEGNCIISNPKTGLSSSYSVDFEDWSNPDVQVHTLDELAANIAADSNLNGIISAIVYDYSVNFEVQLDSTSDAVTNAEAGETKINLGLLVDGDVVDGNLYLSANANGNTAWNGGAALGEEQNPIREFIVLMLQIILHALKAIRLLK